MLHRFNYWQPDDDARTFPDLALEFYHAAIGHDDSLAQRESESYARTRGFGGKKWIEHPLEMLLRNADPVVDDADDHIGTLFAILGRVVFGYDPDNAASTLS